MGVIYCNILFVFSQTFSFSFLSFVFFIWIFIWFKQQSCSFFRQSAVYVKLFRVLFSLTFTTVSICSLHFSFHRFYSHRRSWTKGAKLWRLEDSAAHCIPFENHMEIWRQNFKSNLTFVYTTSFINVRDIRQDTNRSIVSFSNFWNLFQKPDLYGLVLVLLETLMNQSYYWNSHI